MKRSLLREVVSLVIIALVIFNVSTTSAEKSLHKYIELNTIGGGEANGSFEVYVEHDGNWTFIGSQGANMNYKTLEFVVPNLVRNNENMRFKIRKLSGGMSHIDHVSLSNVKPYNMIDPLEHPLDKILNFDNDVMKIEENGIIVEFDLNQVIEENQLKFEFSGRIELEEIGKSVFAYPKANELKRIGSASEFYEYIWDSNVATMTLDGDISETNAFNYIFKEFDKPVSGHPDGYTYGWVYNDDEYLYAVIDFTADNTIDGDRDHSAVFIKTDSAVKQFTVSEVEEQWGLASFVYNDHVNYQHKVYEFKIPRSELDIVEDKPLELAFTAYGTGQPVEAYIPDVLYIPSKNEYLVAFVDYDGSFDSGNGGSGIYGIFIDATGVPLGSQFEIEAMSTDIPAYPRMTYNSEDDEILVVWHTINNNRVYAITLDTDGNDGGDSAITIDDAPGGGETHEYADAAYSPDSDKYFIVWDFDDGSNTIMEGVVTNASLGSSTDIDFGFGGGEMVPDFDIAYDEGDMKFDVVYKAVSGSAIDIRTGRFDKYGTKESMDTVVSTSALNQSFPKLAYNKDSDDHYVTWIDSSDGDMLIGQILNDAGSDEQLSAFLEAMTNPYTLPKGPLNDEMMVFWLENNSGDGEVYSQIIRDDGTLSGSDTLEFSDSGVASHISSDYNSDSDGYLVAYTFVPDVGDPAIAIGQIGDLDYGEIEFDSTSVNVTINEGDSIGLKINRNSGQDGTVTVDYGISGTAESGDYSVASGPAIFVNGDTIETLTVTSNQDADEDDETIVITLSSPLGGASLDTDVTATITILDDDGNGEVVGPTSIYFSNNSEMSVAEGETATLTVTRSGDIVRTSTVDYKTVIGTADTSDFQSQSGTLSFNVNDVNKTISIDINTDSVSESDELFTVVLENASNASLGEIDTSYITITNVENSSDGTSGGSSNSSSSNTTSENSNSNSGASETQSADAVEDLSGTITDVLNTDDTSLSSTTAERMLDVMVDDIENIEDESILSETLTNYVETIEAIAVIGQDSTEENWIEDQVNEIGALVTESIQKIEDDSSILEITSTVIEQLQMIETNSNVEQTSEIKNTIEDLAQSALNRISEIEVEPTVETVDGVSEVTFDQDSIAQRIAEKRQVFEALTGTIEDYYGDENVRDFGFEVTLKSERVSEQVQVPLDPQTLQALNESGVDSLSVEVGGTSVTLDKEVYSSETGEVENLVVDMNFNNQGFEIRDDNVNFKSGYIADVNILANDEKKEKLEKPVELSFDLDAFEFWDESADPSSLSVYKLNEETGEWEAVGGVYDPVTNTVSTRRLTLSQYTVMQSNKSFSDVENSWAKDEINELLGKGIIDESASFNPEETISREEFTTWVVRAYGMVDEDADSVFSDLDEDHEHYKELASAYSAGIVAGNGDGTFAPESAMTKEQMSAILANAMTEYDDKRLNQGLTGTLASASDADLVSDWAGDDIAMLEELGVLDNSSGEINPQQQLSKEEAASILKKIYG